MRSLAHFTTSLHSILIATGKVAHSHTPSHTPSIIWCTAAHAEADTFFCFTALMTEIGDKFTKKLDYSRAGIGEGGA